MMWCERRSAVSWCSVLLSGAFWFVVVFATVQSFLVVECFAWVDDVGVAGLRLTMFGTYLNSVN